MRGSTGTVLLLGGVLALAGCADRKAASNGNFKAAINDYVSRQPACIAAPQTTLRPADDKGSGFPQYVSAAQARSDYDREDRQRTTAPLDALVAAGLLGRSNGQITVATGSSAPIGPPCRWSATT